MYWPQPRSCRIPTYILKLNNVLRWILCTKQPNNTGIVNVRDEQRFRSAYVTINTFGRVWKWLNWWCCSRILSDVRIRFMDRVCPTTEKFTKSGWNANFRQRPPTFSRPLGWLIEQSRWPARCTRIRGGWTPFFFPDHERWKKTHVRSRRNLCPCKGRADKVGRSAGVFTRK
jgi:hypothetical protein